MIQYHVSSICSGQKLTGNVILDKDNAGIRYEEILINTEVNFLERDED